MEKTRRIQTLKENHLFSRAYRKGRCFSGKYVALYVLNNNRDKDLNKLGITVSKNRGNAVKRNRAKRIIREAYRVFHPFIKEGHIIVIVARQPCVEAHVSVVVSELEVLLSNAALL
ncbi:MAG: ribonuclease P protein component [Clostridia bacterium]|nr:ribonuclease P protein component [Clostridia bacterium]